MGKEMNATEFREFVNRYIENQPLDTFKYKQDLNDLVAEIEHDWSNGNSDEYSNDFGPDKIHATLRAENENQYYDEDGNLTDEGLSRYNEVESKLSEKIAREHLSEPAREAVELSRPEDMAKALYAYLDESGIASGGIGGSGKSNSKYFGVMVDGMRKTVRVSDHELPVEYQDANGTADYEVALYNIGDDVRGDGRIKSESVSEDEAIARAGDFINAISPDAQSLNSMDQEEQKNLEMVRLDPFSIKDIENQSEAVQLAAVQQSGYAIRYCEDQSYELQLAAVQQDGESLEYCENPSEDVQLAAVQQNGKAIYSVKNQSYELQLAAVQQNPDAIGDCENPSEDLKMVAVQLDGSAIRHCENQSFELQMAAVQQNGWALQYCENPSESVKMAAVQQDDGALAYCKNPSDTVLAYHLIHHPDSDALKPEIKERAVEILDAHTPGLGNVYLLSRSIGITGDELRDQMLSFIENAKIVEAPAASQEVEFDTGATITKSGLYSVPPASLCSAGMTEYDLMASFDAMDEKLGSHDSSSLAIK